MKKKGMIATLSVLSVSLCALALGVDANRTDAYADEAENEAAKDFYMEQGASVRIDENAGVRFSAHISKTKYNEIKEAAGENAVKVVTIVNRADLGATHGAEQALEFEYNLADISAKDGEYTVISRITYTELAENLVKQAALVELEAKTYIVVDDNWTNAVVAEANDNVRSMRGVAYAALSAGKVTATQVANYLGTVQTEEEVFALLNTAATEIDVADLSAKYEGYTAAYLGAKKIGDVKNGKIALTEAYEGTAETIALMDANNNVVSASLKYAGDLSAEVKSHKYGNLAAFENGTEITLEKDGKQTKVTVTGGKISAENLPAGTYSVYTDDSYITTIAIEKSETYSKEITLEYKVFDLFNGWDEAQHDFSHVNDENSTIAMAGKTLNVISHDKYNEVAVSLGIKKGNSTHTQDVQGIVIKFSNGSYMFTRCEKMSDGTYKLQWVKELWGLPIAKAQWQDYQQPMTDAQNTAFESADGLKLTVIRSGNVLTVYVNGEKILGGTVMLDETYASMTAQVGFFDYDSKENATWKFDIESDISSYNTALEKMGSNASTYAVDVNLTGDVWQAMKVKVNAGYTGEVRIGFKAWHNSASNGYVKSILYQGGSWMLQETDTWQGTKLSEDLTAALTGDGLYLAYHRNATTGEVKIYVGTTKEALASAIESGTALATYTQQAELQKKAIDSLGVIFWDGDYTASAWGYAYGSTSVDALKYLA